MPWKTSAEKGSLIATPTHALAMDLDPRHRSLTLGLRIRSGGAHELWHGAVLRRHFSATEASLKPALAWLQGEEAAALLRTIEAGYQAEMTWAGDWVARWSELAWRAAETLHMRLDAMLRAQQHSADSARL